jgi:hypothetical protein
MTVSGIDGMSADKNEKGATTEMVTPHTMKHYILTFPVSKLLRNVLFYKSMLK